MRAAASATVLVLLLSRLFLVVLLFWSILLFSCRHPCCLSCLGSHMARMLLFNRQLTRSFLCPNLALSFFPVRRQSILRSVSLSFLSVPLLYFPVLCTNTSSLFLICFLLMTWPLHPYLLRPIMTWRRWRKLR